MSKGKWENYPQSAQRGARPRNARLPECTGRFIELLRRVGRVKYFLVLADRVSGWVEALSLQHLLL